MQEHNPDPAATGAQYQWHPHDKNAPDWLCDHVWLLLLCWLFMYRVFCLTRILLFISVIPALLVTVAHWMRLEWDTCVILSAVFISAIAPFPQQPPHDEFIAFVTGQMFARAGFSPSD